MKTLAARIFFDFQAPLYTTEVHIKYGQVTARIFSDFQAPLYTTKVHIKYGQVTARIFSDFQAPLYTMEGHIKYGQITARIFSDFQAPLCTMEVHIKYEQVTERVLYLVKISSWVFKIHQAIFLKIFDYMSNNFLCFMRIIPYFGFLLKENEKREKILQLRKDCETFTIVSESGVQKSIINWNLGSHSLT